MEQGLATPEHAAFVDRLARAPEETMMSTVERSSRPRLLPPLVAGQHLDQPAFHKRYEAMPPETRAELVGGVVYLPSPMRLDHGKADHPVAAGLARYEQFTPGVEGGGGPTVKLDRQGEPQPDHLLGILPECGFARNWESLYRAVSRGVRTRGHAEFVAKLAAVRDQSHRPE